MANTNLVTTVRGQRRYLIYYDPDVVQTNMLLSVSQLIIDPENWRYDQPRETHYNTIMDESTSGYSSLWDIAIPIYVRPSTTPIRGSLRVKENALKTYSVPPTYDVDNNFTYEWFVDGHATIVSGGTSKSVNIQFYESSHVEILCKISNPYGCYVTSKLKIGVGLNFRRMLIARNRF